MLLKTFKYFLFTLLFPLLTAFSQDMPEYFFNHIKNEDGLSQSTIRAIIQDSKGYMWIGTGNGLNRYDGYNFKVFNYIPDDSTSISGNGIASLYEDKEGYIWVGTIDGLLNKYDRKTNAFERIDLVTALDVPNKQRQQFYDYPISFSRNNDNAINSITEDNNGNLWLGTWGKGVIRYNKSNGSINHYYNHPAENNSLSHNRIMKILVDRKQNIWIGTFGGGLNKVVFEDEEELTFRRFVNTPGIEGSLSENKIIALTEDTDGDIWIGTYRGGLNRIIIKDKGEYSFEVYKHDSRNPNSLSNNIIMSLLEDNDGYIWIGTFGGGLNRFEKTTGRFVNFMNEPLSENSLADNDVLSLCVDRSGIIWIGTHLGQ
jgi:ligand-binding sensor domain-containing protein